MGVGVGFFGFIPIAIETYGTLLLQTDDFLHDCARRAFSAHSASSSSTSVLVTWFRQRVVVKLQRAQARAIHARTTARGDNIDVINTSSPSGCFIRRPHEDSGVNLYFWCCVLVGSLCLGNTQYSESTLRSVWRFYPYCLDYLCVYYVAWTNTNRHTG